jgi:hypothetical protein
MSFPVMNALKKKLSPDASLHFREGKDLHLVPELSSLVSFRDFYLAVLALLRCAGQRFLIGGSYAFAAYTGIARDTKDIDLFVSPREFGYVMHLLSDAGYATETTFPHWLGKVKYHDYCIDVIFSSGNGLCDVDEGWFRHSTPRTLDGHLVGLIPPEEMIWMKAYVMERHRFDGGDIIHLIHTCGRHMNWRRLLRRFGAHWEIFFSHLMLFGYVYPAEREKVPTWVWKILMQRYERKLRDLSSQVHKGICYGPFLTGEQYAVPLQSWGYEDPRLCPRGNLSRRDIAQFTKNIKKDSHSRIQWWAKS